MENNGDSFIPPQDIEDTPQVRSSEKQALADTLSTLINSESYLLRLQTVDSKKRPKIIGATIEYAIIHPDLFEADHFLESITTGTHAATEINQDQKFDEAISQLLAESIAKKLNVNLDTKEGKEKVFSHYTDQTQKKGVYYHGFNGVFEEAIKSEGLTPDSRTWDWEDLQRMTEIGTRVGNKSLLGWGSLNSEGKIFFASTPAGIYRYAVASPEWFAQFTSEGWHVQKNGNNKEAYYRRDYETAKQNITGMCDELQSRKKEEIIARRAYPNLTDQERQELLDFFEKYWGKFAGDSSLPKVALIEKAALDGEVEEGLSFEEYCIKMKKDFESASVINAIDTLRGIDGLEVDQRTQESIPPNQMSIITVPEYNRVFPQN